MPTFSHPNSPTPSMSPRMPQEQKWTVSPEFGDALMTAMRERTESGGPVPRLPSLLQLPGSNTIPKPASVPEISPDNAKLTMKTRVAVRDKTPHRFQVVPLREISSFALPAQDTTPLSKTPRGALYIAKLNINGGNKTRTLGVDENSVSAIAQLQERTPAVTSERHERVQILAERNGNPPDLESTCLAIHTSSPIVSNLPEEQHAPAHRTLLSPVLEKVQPHLVTVHRSSMPVRSILRSRNANEHDYSHVKSPSLGSLHEKPPPSQQHDYATLPRVGCRKRTNTLSIDNSALLRGDLAIYEETKNLERRRPLEHNALKRHAIYTQSLYVPHDERGSLPGTKPFTIEYKKPPFLDTKEDASDLNPRQRRVSRSSLQSNNSAARSPHQVSGNYTALCLAVPHTPRSVFPSSSFTQGFSSDSQSSISSIYSQDCLSLNSQNSQATLTQTRPLTHSRLSSDYQLIVRRQTREYGKGTTMVDHPIIVALLAEVDEVLKEWQSI